MAGESIAAFYDAVPEFESFADLLDPALYRALPEGWIIGLSDVVSSTAAIAAGRYKAVNIAGAAVIAALGNALEGRDFPFVFGGDGAAFALPPEYEAVARTVLAATATWAKEDLGLELRVALVPISALRRQGAEVRVARFAASPHVRYAMFSGGGLALAVEEMKRGRFAVEPAPPGSRPNLQGLSCRWREIPARNGVILSVIVSPGRQGADLVGYRQVVRDVLAIAAEAGRPLPPVDAIPPWSLAGLELEARASRRRRFPLILYRPVLMAVAYASLMIFKLGLRVGGFDPGRYGRELVENTDFRKYDDGLRMTLDCTPELAERVERRLVEAAENGIAQAGVHRQDAALMTCFVPSPWRSDHVHFIDGAGGGYSAAALGLKMAEASSA